MKAIVNQHVTSLLSGETMEEGTEIIVRHAFYEPCTLYEVTSPEHLKGTFITPDLFDVVTGDSNDLTQS
ncbi:hypothetical protein [Paenibacillus sp. 8b26]|uniref:hypothetical protein n=1 Tax=Paenibacillus sp. 8b26 TaxID=3424133 RepID=UPI003D65E377